MGKLGRQSDAAHHLDPVSPVSEEVPAWKWWYRWVGSGALLALGLVSLAFAVPEAVRLVGDLRALPPVITVGTSMAAMLPLGLGMLGAALFFLFPPVLMEQRRRALGLPPHKGTLKRTKAFVFGLLACLLLYPILSLALREGTGSFLEARGYVAQTVDQRLGAKSSTLRWARSESR